MEFHDILISVLFFIGATLYSSVGHGGASGYLAIMAMMLISPAEMRPAALILNVLVSSIAGYRFIRAGAFSLKVFLPLALASIPLAFIGGHLSLPGYLFKPFIGVVLIIFAVQLFTKSKQVRFDEIRNVNPLSLGLIGGGLGLLSGLTGIGGGIFLSPILVYFRLAPTRVVSGIAAGFILVNSISGLIGVMRTSPAIPHGISIWAVGALLGGMLGATYGSSHLTNSTIRRLLSVVTLMAGLKMMTSV
jgi:hypothetical protein